MRVTKREALRRSPSGAALLIWLLGLYALPLVHNLDHRADHTHGASQTHPHAHEGRAHAQPRDAAHDGPAGKEAPVPIDSDHGRNSVLHFATAALRGETLAVEAAVALVALAPPPTPREAPVPVRKPSLARGPPRQN